MDFNVFKNLIHAASTERGVDEFDKSFNVNLGTEDLTIYNAGYLLGQTMRQIALPADHYHISKGAYDLYLKYGITPTGNYMHCFKIDNHKYKFNKFLMNDHVKPLNELIKELFELDNQNNLTPETFIEVVNKIHICVITKEEDRKLSKHGYKQKRPGYFDSIICGAYKECGIEVIK